MEFDGKDIIQTIEDAVREYRYRTDRIGDIKALTRRLAAAYRWNLAFNIAEGIVGFGPIPMT